MAEFREFKTGATRTPDDDKIDYEGFLSPLTLIRFGEYMHKHRKKHDGTLRESDNWQKGIPISSYVKSMFRHFVSVWFKYRVNKYDEAFEEELCAIIFNAQGILHEHLKNKGNKPKRENILH